MIPYPRPLLESDRSLIDEFRPTAGEPIRLCMMPSGVNLVVHLRPALLWSDDSNFRVLRASLTDGVTNWIATQLERACRRSPSEIEEATIGMILGARGVEPQLCAVIRLKDPAALSELSGEFGDRELTDSSIDPGVRLRADDRLGYLIPNPQTVAICPLSLVRELTSSIDVPNGDVSEGLSQLLRQTDRDRLFTIAGGIDDLRRHIDSLVPPVAQPPLSSVLDWLGEDVEFACWSIHPDPYLHSQLMLRPAPTMLTAQLQRRISEKLEQLPVRMWQDVALTTRPRELRSRRFIGRFPAMLEACSPVDRDSDGTSDAQADHSSAGQGGAELGLGDSVHGR